MSIKLSNIQQQIESNSNNNSVNNSSDKSETYKALVAIEKNKWLRMLMVCQQTISLPLDTSPTDAKTRRSLNESITEEFSAVRTFITDSG